VANEEPTLQERYEAALAELPPKQRKLVVEYLRDLHQRNAAIRAGYSEKTADVQASQILRKLKCQEAVNLGLQLHAMSASEVLARLTAQGRGSMGDFLRTDEEEITLTWSLLSVPTTEEGEIDMAGAMLRLAIQENVKPTDRVLRTETIKRAVARLDLLAARQLLHLVKKYSLDEKGRVSIELYDAQAALALLGKHHRLFVDRTEHTGAGGAPIEVSDARNKLAALLTRRAEGTEAAADPGGDAGAEER
jgi:phage terminase small subunit